MRHMGILLHTRSFFFFTLEKRKDFVVITAGLKIRIKTKPTQVFNVMQMFSLSVLLR